MDEILTQTAPKSLRNRGRGLWKEITTTYVLDAGEMQILTELCRACDYLDELDRFICDETYLVHGSRGQLPKANPLLVEVRETQKLIVTLTAALALPLPGEQVGRRRSPNQKAAAETRWSRERRLVDVDG